MEWIKRKDLGLRMLRFRNLGVCWEQTEWRIRVRELCGVKKWVDERTDEYFLRWLDHTEIMWNSGIVKRIWNGGYTGSCLLRLLRKRWIDLARDWLKNWIFGCRESKKNVAWQEWRGVGWVVKEEFLRLSPVYWPLSLSRGHSCWLPQVDEDFLANKLRFRLMEEKGMGVCP